MSTKFSQHIIGNQNAALIIATLISARIWFEVNPGQGDSWMISVEQDECELLKRIVLIAKDI